MCELTCTTTSVLSNAHVVALVVWVRSPINNIGLAINELNVVGALSITVSGTIFGTSHVVASTIATVLIHLHKVTGSIHSALQFRHVEFHGELSVLEIEHLVLVGAVHNEKPRSRWFPTGGL